MSRLRLRLRDSGCLCLGTKNTDAKDQSKPVSPFVGTILCKRCVETIKRRSRNPAVWYALAALMLAQHVSV